MDLPELIIKRKIGSVNNRKDILKILDEIQYIDMHIHLENYYKEELGFHKSILFFANSINQISYKKTLKLAEQIPNIIPSFGIHPMEASNCTIPQENMEKLMIGNDFIGVIGMDQFWIEDTGTYGQQQKMFETQLSIIKKHKMIPTIHTKGAEEEILELLIKYGISNSIIHWYSGPLELIEKYLALGCYFTIGPDIFSDSQVYKKIPLNRMFAETDNPTGIPWVIGGDPAIDDIKKVYGKLSQKLNKSEENLIVQFKKNLSDLIKEIF
jgi:TatD DNase family protein